jgi:phosphoserine phosphatase RsbU/P
MRVLVADDDQLAGEVLTRTLVSAQHEVIRARDGGEAMAILQQPDSPSLAILDWMMPVLNGPDVCRLIRSEAPDAHRYLILLTSRDTREDVVAGLAAGADDYLVKPFHQGELLARVSVGVRMLGLQDGLAARVADLEIALSRVKQLSGLLPICSYCKSIRSDDNYWHAVEAYIGKHSNTQFSHGVCPPCFERISKELDDYDAGEPGLSFKTGV